MATLIFTSGVFEGCIIDDKGQWKDKLDCRTYSSSSKKLKLLFHKKWLKKSVKLNLSKIEENWDDWLNSWQTEVWDNSDVDYIWNRTEF
jgi:hypothetical protein